MKKIAKRAVVYWALGMLILFSSFSFIASGEMETFFIGLVVSAVLFFLGYLKQRKHAHANAKNTASAPTRNEPIKPSPSNVSLVQTKSKPIVSMPKIEVVDSSSRKLNSSKMNYGTKKWYNAIRNSFIVIDLETTGLSEKYERIIEVCAIKYENGIETDRFLTLINPNKKISKNASDINNITNEMVSSAPTFSDISDKLLEFLQGYIIAAHNARFDIGFIEAEFSRLNYDFKCFYVDTLSIARKVLPYLSNHKLQTILDEIGFMRDSQHRGETDCEGCAAILAYAIAVYEKEQLSKV